MIERDLSAVILKESKKYPVVTLTGPRQSGKTTLVRALFPGHHYCNLEDPKNRRLAEEDAEMLFEKYPGRVIFDEVQRVPELLSWIQVIVDEKKEKGQFILTGSHQPLLHKVVSQSLAGRTALFHLLPLSLSELTRAGHSLKKSEALFKGFLPRVYDDELDPVSAYRTYFRTYVERDVRQLVILKDIALFEKFVKLLAGRVGQLINMSSLANDVGVSQPTISEWIAVLEASFIIFRLPPYYQNFGKRLVRSPKIYFTEPGLAAWLLDIETADQALRDPLHGNLFENMVVVEALKQRHNQGRSPNLYFWRDTRGNEIDLIWDRQRKLIPIEIKSAMTWSRDFPKAMKKFQKSIPDALPGHVIYSGDTFPRDDDFSAHRFSKMGGIFGAGE